MRPAMQLASGWGASRWRRFGLVAALAINAVFLVIIGTAFFLSDVNTDWTLDYSEAARRLFSGGLYDWTLTQYGVHYVFRYSPLLAYAFAALLPLGVIGWTVAHFVPLLALPRRMAGILLISAPFWADVYYGNVTIFAFAAAWLALTGSNFGTLAFLELALLVPRPIMVPLLIWILWRRPAWRVRFAGILVVNGILVALTGNGLAWITSFTRAGDDFAARADFGPAHVFGAIWIPIGLALAAWLTWRGRVGFASLAAAPYWLPPYFMMALLPEPRDADRFATAPAPASRRVDPFTGGPPE